jgi:putative endonuclease
VAEVVTMTSVDEVAPPPGRGAGRIALGAWGEDRAADYLAAHGWWIEERNWRCRAGEIDLVAWDPGEDSWVAVEVKTRRGAVFGDAIEAVTSAKAGRLRTLARQWLDSRAAGHGRIRIDVVGIVVHACGGELTHVRAVGR